jgi:hypothetical protein
MESGLMGPYLSAIAAARCNQGYARSSIRRHLRAADQFGAWLLKHGMSINDISTSTADCYLEGLDRQYSPSCPGGRLPHKALGVRALVEFLGLQGVLRPDIKQQQSTATDRWLADFDHHLEVAGDACRTRSNYVRYARRLLTECFGAEEPNWAALQSEQVTDFVRKEAAKLQPSSCGHLSC